jgi:hypothetical protein
MKANFCVFLDACGDLITSVAKAKIMFEESRCGLLVKIKWGTKRSN